MANLVGDDESGDALIDENEPVQPLQQPDAEDYSDPNWEPEPVDAGPGKHDFLFLSDYLGYDSSFTFCFPNPKISGRTSRAISSARSSASTTLRICS